ncbi:MAG: cyclic nucleotide-binding domain-containing protein [Chloroflexota bacterium]|nr:cyclic nucleotide-binding domain-containing protein [Chloroflexota bacterium]
MEIEHQKVVELLDQSPLFAHLKDDELNWLAKFFQPAIFRGGEAIFNPGDTSEVMYLILEGHVDLITEDERILSFLKIGDFFGEEALLYDDPRFYQAVAESNSVLLQFSADQYLIISEELSGIEEKLEVLIRSRKLSAHVDLPWLQEDEHVHVITRRHPAILWSRMVLPILFGFATFFGAIFTQHFWLPERSYGWILLAVACPLAIFWLIWRIFDWRNDYFIVTNKRVVWIEKVALIYESRQEAPLRTIMSVGLHRSRIGRIFDFADVVVMTYVGTIRLRDLKRAESVESLIESYWHRSESFNRLDEAQVMAQKLDEKLELPWDDTQDTHVSIPEVVDQETGEEPQEPGFVAWLFSDFIRLRYESSGAIVYRKHWFILIKRIWLPFLSTLITLAVLVGRSVGLLTFFDFTSAIIFLFVILLVCLMLMIYQYADWRNDIFKVTLDQITDIDRKPLGRIRRRSAPLENILSIEYERQGFWGFLFNFGTVYITVGNMKLSFDHVYKPSEVQQDIFYRMGERLEKIRKFEIETERERFSDWIASYHQKTEKYRNVLENKSDQINPEF